MQGNFQKIIQSDIPVLIDFHADWCQPCKVQAPILKDFVSQMGDKVKVIKIDVDKNPGIAQQYQIQGVPTLAIFRDGELVWRQSGVLPLEGLKQAIDPFL